MTERLYYTDSYIKDFEAVVIEAGMENDRDYVILNRTAFFPEGGGQTSDTGTFLTDKGILVKVLDVQEKDDAIFHYLDKPLERGMHVKGLINWQERFRKMQNHTAEHLLCGIIHNEFGYDNVGFHLSKDAVTFDINGELDSDIIGRIEKKANELIYANLRVTISIPSASELKKLIYRSKLDMTEDVRIVTIENVDRCACCAPHVNSLAEIGVIKIVDHMPHRGGTRLTLLAGSDAYDDYVKLDRANKQIMGIVSSKRYETAEHVERLDEKCKKLMADNVALRKQLGQLSLKEIEDRLEKREASCKQPFIIFSEVLDDVALRNVINSCVAKVDAIVAGFLGDDTEGYRYIVACKESLDINLKDLSVKINNSLEGRGGGSKQMIQGSVKAKRNTIEKVLNEIDTI